MNAIFIHCSFSGCRQTLPYAAGVTHYVDSEVGRLGTVLLHRPGPELARLTPRNNDSLLFDAIPWVGRAQEEHDAFAAALRERGVEVLYLATLLAETLAVADARAELTEQVLRSRRLGDTLRARVADHLAYLDPVALADVLTAGLAHEELRISSERPGGLVYTLMDRHDFVIDPLPNLLFTRDSSLWIGDRVGVTSLAMPARRRETTLTDAIYRHHPRFAGTEFVYRPDLEHLEGGDVLLLAPGVLAVGVGERTTPAGAERLGRQVFAAGLAHTILVVPIAQKRATMHLDTVCTMVDVRRRPHVSQHRQHAVGVHRDRRTRTARTRGWTAPRPSCGPPPTRWTSTSSGSSTPGWTRSPRNASSGTTATTLSPWHRGSASATNATSRPTPNWSAPASRSSRSPARSWAPAGADRAACPAPSSATPCPRTDERAGAAPEVSGG